MVDGKLLCILKKSNEKDYGLFEIKNTSKYEIQWERAMTAKEALKKVERIGSVDAVVIEDAKEKDVDTIAEISSKGVKVVLLGGNVTYGKAINVQTVQEVISQIDYDNTDIKIENNDDVDDDEIVDLYSGQIEKAEDISIDTVSGIDVEKFEQMVAERNNWKTLATNAQYELKLLKDKMQSIITDENIIEYMSSGLDVGALQRQNEEMSREVTRLSEQVRAFGAERSKHRDTELRLGKTEEALTGAKVTISNEYDDIEILRSTIIKLTYFGNDLMEQLRAVKNNLAASVQEKKAALQTAADSKTSVQEYMDKIDELEQQISRLTGNIEEIKESNEELSLDIKNLEEDKRVLKGQLSEARDKIADAVDREQKALDEAEKKEVELARYRSYKVEDMQDIIAQDKQMSNEYEQALGELSIKLDAFRQENLELKQQVESYKEMANAAKNRATARERIYNGDGYSAIKVDYIGKAQVIAVVGSGGYGTTSVAVALARILNEDGSNVAIVDLDTRSPKMDSNFNVNPFNIEVLQRAGMVDENRMTSVGALIKIGNSWDRYFRDLGIDVTNIKNNTARLVYHSGSYAALSATEIGGANYATLLARLGIDNDYIILDLGRFECSGSISNVQTGICKIANKVYIVTNTSLTDIRSMMTRVSPTPLRQILKQTCWVTNMYDGKIDDRANKILESAGGVVNVPVVRDKYGSNFELSENRKTRPQIELLAAYIS